MAPLLAILNITALFQNSNQFFRFEYRQWRHRLGEMRSKINFYLALEKVWFYVLWRLKTTLNERFEIELNRFLGIGFGFGNGLTLSIAPGQSRNLYGKATGFFIRSK